MDRLKSLLWWNRDGCRKGILGKVGDGVFEITDFILGYMELRFVEDDGERLGVGYIRFVII